MKKLHSSSVDFIAAIFLAPVIQSLLKDLSIFSSHSKGAVKDHIERGLIHADETTNLNAAQRPPSCNLCKTKVL